MEFQHVATSLSRVRDSTRMTLFGRAVDGRSVAVHIDRVPYYGYVQASCAELGDLRIFVSTWCRYQKASKYGLQPRNEETREDAFRKLRVADFALEECSGFNIRDVREGPELPFTRFKTTAPSVWRALNKMLTACKEATDEMEGWAIDEGFRLDMPAALPARMLYETHFTPDALYMVDHRLTSCGWMRAYGPRADAPGLTTCDVEIQARDVEPFAAPQDLAPLRVLSYDIEAQPHVYDDGREPGFPQPQEDPILTIGVVWFDLLDTTMRQAVFQLEPADVPPLRALAALEAPPDAFDPSTSEVFSYTDEHQLLLGFASYVRKADPDIVTGYNIVGFDNAYLIQRAEALGIRADRWRSTTRVHLYLGRMREEPTALRKIFRSSKQKGGRESYETSLEGRCWNDIISAIRTDHKLRSYKLDDVAEEFLGTKKIHIAYDRIPDMQKTKEGRHTLASYCVKDAWLPCQLGVRLSKFINGLSMAQVTGVSLDAVWHRGQQVRTITLMLSYTRRRSQRWFLPDERNIKQPEHSFEGAVVITPMPGFYEQPVVTLDFASLYPSIMRAYNTCFSTLIATPAQARARGFHFSDADPDPTFRPVRAFETAPVTAESKQNPFRYVESPEDTCFVTRKVRRGILPEILETLLTKRKQVKKRMKSLEDGTVAYSVADGYQLALKVCANSVYGFTGASTGFLPEKRIASAVTKAGRGMTNEAKYKVEFHYRDHGLRVVYGDTDSIFVHLPESLCPLGTPKQVEERATALGEAMSELCNTCFLPPNDLEYEKFYWPILLKGKKRYAGWKVEPGKKTKLDVKGFECVRRDFAPIVSETQKKVFELLIKERDTPAAVAFATKRVQDLMYGRCELRELTLSKQLTQPPENYASSAAHVALAKRLIATLPATVAPKVGDRIDFLIRTGREKLFERAITPDEAAEGKYEVDLQYYLEKQLRKPLFRVFDMVVPNPEDIFRVTGFKRTIPKSSPFAQFVTGRPALRDAPARDGANPRKKKKKIGDIRSFF